MTSRENQEYISLLSVNPILLLTNVNFGEISQVLEQTYVFGEKCKDFQFLAIINFLENYVPLVLINYAVIFRSNNNLLHVSALKRIWLMFFCFARHHYDKSPLVFLCYLVHCDKVAHPLSQLCFGLH